MMTKSLKQAYWHRITGLLDMGYVVKDEKVYIDIDAVLAVLGCYQRKLANAGLMKISGLNPSGILELFDILKKDFHLLNFLGGTCEEDNLSQPSPSPQADLSAVIPPRAMTLSQLKEIVERRTKTVQMQK